MLRIRLIALSVLVLALVRCADGRREWSTIDLLKPAAGTLDRALRVVAQRDRQTENGPREAPWGRSEGFGSAGRIRTSDLKVMSLASYRTAPPRDAEDMLLHAWPYVKAFPLPPAPPAGLPEATAP